MEEDVRGAASLSFVCRWEASRRTCSGGRPHRTRLFRGSSGVPSGAYGEGEGSVMPR